MPSRAQCVPTKTDRSLSCSRLRIADSHGLGDWLFRAASYSSREISLTSDDCNVTSAPVFSSLILMAPGVGPVNVGGIVQLGSGGVAHSVIMGAAGCQHEHRANPVPKHLIYVHNLRLLLVKAPIKHLSDTGNEAISIHKSWNDLPVWKARFMSRSLMGLRIVFARI